MLIMTGEVRGEWLGPDSGAPVNGDQVRDTWFLRRDRSFSWRYTTAKWDTWGYRGLGDVGWGYAASEVDDLLRRVTAELDADRSAGWLIKNATFQRKLSGPRYDIDAVDWFLGQFLLPQDHVPLPGLSDDPWRDLAVAQLAQNEVSDLTGRHPPSYKPTLRDTQVYFNGLCEKAWRDFGQVPGTHLWWGGTGKFRTELRTAEQQALASKRGLSRETVSAGGRNFTYKKTGAPANSAAGSWPLGITELAARSWRDCAGHFAAETMSTRGQQEQARMIGELVDETGTPIMYRHGHNLNHRAYGCITFPDQRWVRFWVRGIYGRHGIMTAVDQAGKKVARYRIIDNLREKLLDLTKSVEITVHPDRKLTDELVLVIMESAEWLASYYRAEGHGGG